MKVLQPLIYKLLFTAIFLTFGISASGADPGRPVRDRDDARRPVTNDQRPGSVLVYNLYTSNSTDPGKSDTDFSVTNSSVSQSTFVHVFFISESGTTADAIICLTPNQTTSFQASDVDPGVTGYAILYAINNAGCPISFNYLIGSERFKMDSGLGANLPAEGYAALYSGTLPGCSPTSTTATLALDGVQYTAAPSLLGADKIPSSSDGNVMMLVVNGLEGNLALSIPQIKSVSGTLFNNGESAFAFNLSPKTPGAQFKSLMNDDFPQTNPKFTQVIKVGETGWMRVMGDEGRGITGAVINFHPNTATRKGAFNGGHNLHHLRSGASNLIVPVFAPTC